MWDMLGGSTMRMPIPQRAKVWGTWGALWASAVHRGCSSFTLCAETHLKMPLAVSSSKSVQGDSLFLGFVEDLAERPSAGLDVKACA